MLSCALFAAFARATPTLLNLPARKVCPKLIWPMTYSKRPAPRFTSPPCSIASMPPLASPSIAKASSPPSPKRSPARTVSCAPRRTPSACARRPDDHFAGRFPGYRCRLALRLPSIAHLSACRAPSSGLAGMLGPALSVAHHLDQRRPASQLERGAPHGFPCRRFCGHEQTSRGKFGRLPRTTARFTLCALDGYGLCGEMPARPTLTPRIRFLYISPRVCSTLLSDPPSPERPCASLTLPSIRLGKGLSPSNCRTCSAHISRRRHSRHALHQSDCRRAPPACRQRQPCQLRLQQTRNPALPECPAYVRKPSERAVATNHRGHRR